MLSVKPYKSILELLKAFPNEQACIDHLEYLRWDGNVISPFNEASKVYKCKNNRYKCLTSNKYFNVRSGTIFEGSKIPLQHWFVAIYLFTISNKGLSSYTLATEMNITQKSAWFMLQRIRYAMDHESFIKEVEGITQIDETFVGGKNGNRHHNKKVKYLKRGIFEDKTTVVGLYKNGVVKGVVAKDRTAPSLRRIVGANVPRYSVLVTDDWRGYKNLYTIFEHYTVNHSRGRYVNSEGFTTNHIENFWTQLKKTFIGTYSNIVSPKHMQKYVNEVAFRYNQREAPVSDKIDILLQDTNGKRLTYKALIGKNG